MKKLGKIVAAGVLILVALFMAMLFVWSIFDMIRTQNYLWLARMAVIILFSFASSVPFLRSIKTGRSGLWWLTVATLFGVEMINNVILENSFRVVLFGLATAWAVWIHFKELKRMKSIKN